jgi:hypothetical protein
MLPTVLEKKRTYRLTRPRTSKPLLLIYRFLIEKKQNKSRLVVLIPSNLKDLKLIARLGPCPKLLHAIFCTLNNNAMFFTISPTFHSSDQILLTIGNRIFGSKLSSGKCNRNCISPSKGNFNK